MALDTNIIIQATVTETSALGLVTATAPMTFLQQTVLANGTGAAQADKVYQATRTLGPSATEDLDLAGVLFTPLGAAFTLARLKAVIVTAAAANTNNVTVTRATTNGVTLFTAASAGLAVRPGGSFAWVAPDVTAQVVTAGTGDLLTFTNSAAGTSVTYNVIFIGSSV